VYSVSDTAAALAGAVGAGLNEAVNLTATTAATVAFATTIDAATNSGTNTYAVSDTAGNLATGFTTADPGLAAVQGATSVDVAGGAGTLTLTASQLSNMMAGSSDLAADDSFTFNAASNFGTLDVIGGSGTINLAVDGGANAVTINLGTSGATTINLHGTGNHDVTAGSVVETFILNNSAGDYDGGAIIRGMAAGDVINVDGTGALAAFTTVEVSAGAVDAAGEYFFGSGVLTYYDNVAAAQESIALIGVNTILLSSGDAFTVLS
jgi:hypothetical protein